MAAKGIIAELERLWNGTDRTGRDAIIAWIAENKDNRPVEDYPVVSPERHEELARARRLSEIGDFINRVMQADPEQRLSRTAFANALRQELPEANVAEAWEEYLLWAQVKGWTYREAADVWERC